MELLKNQGKVSYPFSLTFTFEKGEHKGETYKGHFEICSNPICTCRDVRFIIENADENSTDDPKSKKQYSFYIDIFKKKIKEGRKYNLSTVDKNFATSFINELSEGNWQDLQTIFYSYKAYITENCDLQELNPTFPAYEIEHTGLMISYHEIFPYAKDITFRDGDIDYLVDDQYCLNPKCSCKDVGLTIVPIINGKSLNGYQAPAVRYNYKNNKWERERDSSNKLYNLDKIMVKLPKSIPNISDILKKRHKKLRLLYKNCNSKNDIENDNVLKQKIGRNDPCPCGSGKKYKYCCGR